MDLDVGSPDEVANVLREAAESYYQAEEDLAETRQGNREAIAWVKIAKILERAANQIEKIPEIE